MPNKHNGRGLTPTSSPTTTARTAPAAELELAHEGPLPTASLRRAGDEALPPDGPANGDVPVSMTFRKNPKIRKHRSERDLLGIRVPNPGEKYRLAELARFLRCDIATVKRYAKLLRLLRKLPQDHRFAPLSRDQAKALIARVRQGR